MGFWQIHVPLDDSQHHLPKLQHNHYSFSSELKKQSVLVMFSTSAVQLLAWQLFNSHAVLKCELKLVKMKCSQYRCKRKAPELRDDRNCNIEASQTQENNNRGSGTISDSQYGDNRIRQQGSLCFANKLEAEQNYLHFLFNLHHKIKRLQSRTDLLHSV